MKKSEALASVCLSHPIYLRHLVTRMLHTFDFYTLLTCVCTCACLRGRGWLPMHKVSSIWIQQVALDRAIEHKPGGTRTQRDTHTHIHNQYDCHSCMRGTLIGHATQLLWLNSDIINRQSCCRQFICHSSIILNAH